MISSTNKLQGVMLPYNNHKYSSFNDDLWRVAISQGENPKD
ncbi:MAG: hypothetical protein ACLFM1_04710 [Bacteroidales bacterium]